MFSGFCGVHDAGKQRSDLSEDRGIGYVSLVDFERWKWTFGHYAYGVGSLVWSGAFHSAIVFQDVIGLVKLQGVGRLRGYSLVVLIKQNPE